MAESLQALRAANDGVTAQPQVYKNSKPNIDPSSGSLMYEYPINLPKDRNGSAPQISLKYNSQNLKDGSPFGYGWGINIPYIETLNKKVLTKCT